MKLRPTWAEINLKAAAHNMREIRRVTNPESKICAVVKANGYGHGAVEISRVALENGADYLAVAVLDEAIQLRAAGIKVPILILGYTPDELAKDVIQYEITQTILNVEMAQVFSRAAGQLGQTAKIHIKIDTGMSRIGFLPGEKTIEDIREIAGLPNLLVEGIFTHFADSDTTDKSFTHQQLKTFLEIVSELERVGVKIPIHHAANSAAIIDLPESHLDMVRLGIALYGLYPSEEVQKEKIKLIPVMSLKARVVQVKTVPPGSSVSYGRTWYAQRETTVASLPLGYADGFTRLLSSKGELLIHGQRAGIIGRVCMDQCMADVTAIPGVKVGDEAVLFGLQAGAALPVEELAAKIGTINYEVVCMLSERVPRLYIK